MYRAFPVRLPLADGPLPPEGAARPSHPHRIYLQLHGTA